MLNFAAVLVIRRSFCRSHKGNPVGVRNSARYCGTREEEKQTYTTVVIDGKVAFGV